MYLDGNRRRIGIPVIVTVNLRFRSCALLLGAGGTMCDSCGSMCIKTCKALLILAAFKSPGTRAIHATLRTTQSFYKYHVSNNAVVSNKYVGLHVTVVSY